MRHRLPNHEPITVHLPSEHVRELKRRALERGRGRTHADFIRDAIARYLEAGAVKLADRQTLAFPVDAPPRGARPTEVVDDLPFYVHVKEHVSSSFEPSSICGMHGLTLEHVTIHRENATCPKCIRIVDRTRDIAMADAAKSVIDDKRRAAKRAAKHAASKRASAKPPTKKAVRSNKAVRR